jgi:hypothetical protein
MKGFISNTLSGGGAPVITLSRVEMASTSVGFDLIYSGVEAAGGYMVRQFKGKPNCDRILSLGRLSKKGSSSCQREQQFR